MNKSDWIYVKMASMSVYRCYAKCVLGTKTLILSPPRDSSAIINNNNKTYEPKKVSVLPAANKAIPGRTMCTKYQNKD